MARLSKVTGRQLWLAAHVSWRKPNWIGNAVLNAWGLKKKGDWKMRVRRLTSGLAARGIIERLETPATKYRMVGVYRFSDGALAALDTLTHRQAGAA
ncbi:hypothetical protein ACO2Q3_09080 [Caulobacter sp. KR2-114]|uniref:hypothetical protein n=1 Tax=Caulobacter sp. KR2-114 TaxID=3400912 RepID=UPI003C0E42AE